MFYVIFLDDNGKLHVKDKQFPTRKIAAHYAQTISTSRLPIVVEGPAVTRVCDNPHCYWFADHRCNNTPEGRDQMGFECALYQP